MKQNLVALYRVLLVAVPLVVSAEWGTLGTLLNISSPTGGEKVQAGGFYVIRWHNAPALPRASILFSVGGKLHGAVAIDIRNTGEFVWKVPSLLASDAKILVAAFDETETIYAVGVTERFQIVVPAAPHAPRKARSRIRRFLD